MSTTLVKPRWEAWENRCIQTAFAEKIQHKIVAVALGKTVPSISKKIKNLGLRTPSSLRGKVKGKKQTLPRAEKTSQDLAKMIEILKTYAPLTCFQTGHLALQKGCWTQSQPALDNNQPKKGNVDSINYYNFSFSFVKPFKGNSLTEPFSKKRGVKKIQGDPAYVPLYYVDQWAVSEGFQKTRGVLQERGITYWKNGSYFSQTQFLMHVNRLRFERQLQPIALIEEEGCLLS